MGRQSLAIERRSEIVAAFEHCVRTQGLAGASLDRVAERAGRSRQLVLHYFGSRDGLVEAAIEKLVERYRERIDRQLARLDEKERLGALLDWVLGPDFCDPEADALLAELTGRARREPATRDAIFSAYRHLEEAIVTEISRAHPAASAVGSRAIAFLVMSLCFGASQLVGLGFPGGHLNSTRAVIDGLLQELTAETGAPH